MENMILEIGRNMNIKIFLISKMKDLRFHLEGSRESTARELSPGL